MATARELLTSAFFDLGVIAQGMPLSAFQAQQGLIRLNRMMQGWTLQRLTIPYVSREVFDAIVGKGSPSNPYTIGPGGDFNTTRPTNILGFSQVQFSGLETEVEMPRGILTQEAWQGVSVKRLTSALGTDLYYQPTSPLGRIYIWPVASTTDYKIVLYLPAQLSEFAALDTSYSLPAGAEEAISYNVALRLMPMFTVPQSVQAQIVQLARSTLGTFKRGNTTMADLGFDLALTRNGKYGYNILTDQG